MEKYRLKDIREAKRADLLAALDRDPAAKSKWEVRFTYPGYKALCRYRRAHWFYTRNMLFVASVISKRARHRTGVEIHPGATIGNGVFIDHGAGVVIGETTEIGDNVTIYQGVTLGGTGKDTGKRHPTIEDDVMISAGAKVLGPFRVGKGSKIGAGSVVLKEVPPYSTVVGVPGRIVKMMDKKVNENLDQVKCPDPILAELKRLNKRIETLEGMLDVNGCKYSIATAEGEALMPDRQENIIDRVDVEIYRGDNEDN